MINSCYQCGEHFRTSSKTVTRGSCEYSYEDVIEWIVESHFKADNADYDKQLVKNILEEQVNNSLAGIKEGFNEIISRYNKVKKEFDAYKEGIKSEIKDINLINRILIATSISEINAENIIVAAREEQHQRYMAALSSILTGSYRLHSSCRKDLQPGKLSQKDREIIWKYKTNLITHVKKMQSIREMANGRGVTDRIIYDIEKNFQVIPRTLDNLKLTLEFKL